jgi:hypothetical protein
MGPSGRTKMPKQDTRERVAQNFIEHHGAAGLARLLEALSDGESGQVIADEFNVSRERVRQWKNAFGRSVTLYQVHPEVRRVLQERSASQPGGPQVSGRQAGGGASVPATTTLA